MEAKRILLLLADWEGKENLAQFLSPLSGDWDMVFSRGIAEALELMASSPFHVLVVDPTLSTLALAEFLNRVKMRHPDVSVFVWFEEESVRALEGCLGTSLQTLSWEAGITVIRDSLKRAMHLRSWLSSYNTRSLIAKMKEVPSLPQLYTQIMRVLQNPAAEMEDIAVPLTQDPALCAKLLKTVNSALFGLSNPVASAYEAVMYLGVERTKSLVLFSQLISQVNTFRCRRFSIDALWHHSLRSAAFARWITQEEGCEMPLADEAFTAGLLHDVGRLLLAANLPDLYDFALNLVTQGKHDLVAAETQVFGITHGEIGACLLGMWGLPVSILEAVAWHHSPGASGSAGFCGLTAVHVADSMESLMQNIQPGKPGAGLDLQYLADIGLQDRIPIWRELCTTSITS
jgi:HD-like signal output (HDOD) protein